MITPLEIQNKEFPKVVRGYREEDVDMFLDIITLDLEKLVKENKNLKTQMESISEELERYKSAEGEVIKVLKQAQDLMSDISVSAERRAEVLLKNAELDAELIVREARNRAERLTTENEGLEKRYQIFRGKYKDMLESEVSRMENIDDDFTLITGDNKLEELLSTPIPSKQIKIENEDDDMFKTMIIKPKKED